MNASKEFGMVILALGSVGAWWWWTQREGSHDTGTGGATTYPYVPYTVPEGTPSAPPTGVPYVPASPTPLGVPYVPEATAGAPDYRAMASEAALDNGVPVPIFLGLIERESNFNPDAVGSTGDVGIAQLNPRYHPRGVAEDPAQALPYAARYLKRMFNRFGSWEEALAAYNWGPTNLDRSGISNIPPSVRTYVDAILGR